MEDNNIGRVSAEVLELLKNFPESVVSRIPKTFLDQLEKHKDKSLNVIIDDSKKLFEQDVCEDTQIMMYLIYRDYWATPDEREKINARIKQIKKDFNEEYSADNLFNNNQSAEYDQSR